MTDTNITLTEPGAQQVQISGGQPDTVVILSDTNAGRVQVSRDSSEAITVVRPSPGAGGLDGFPVFVSSPKNGDVISFNGSAFTNRAQVELTDGGNF